MVRVLFHVAVAALPAAGMAFCREQRQLHRVDPRSGDGPRERFHYDGCTMPPLMVVILYLTVFVRIPTGIAEDALSPWQSGVQIRPVAPDEMRPSIHAYFNVSPESPDGKYVLYYTAASADGETGDIRILACSSMWPRMTRTFRSRDCCSRNNFLKYPRPLGGEGRVRGSVHGEVVA